LLWQAGKKGHLIQLPVPTIIIKKSANIFLLSFGLRRSEDE